MKKHLFSLIVALIPYIAISLKYWNFNMKYWDNVDRLCTFIFVILFYALGYCIYMILYNKNTDED